MCSSDLDLEKFAAHYQDKFILTPENCAVLGELYDYLSRLKTTWMHTTWIDEEKEELICDQFGIGPGDVYRHTESVRWLLHAAGQIARLTGQRKLTFDLEDLRNRVHYGIKEELLEIVQLRGVGRVRARILFNKGFKKLSDFKYKSVDELSKINQIGKTLAQDILHQIDNPAPKKFRERATAETSTTANDEWED